MIVNENKTADIQMDWMEKIFLFTVSCKLKFNVYNALPHGNWI